MTFGLETIHDSTQISGRGVPTLSSGSYWERFSMLFTESRKGSTVRRIARPQYNRIGSPRDSTRLHWQDRRRRVVGST